MNVQLPNVQAELMAIRELSAHVDGDCFEVLAFHRFGSGNLYEKLKAYWTPQEIMLNDLALRMADGYRAFVMNGLPAYLGAKQELCTVGLKKNSPQRVSPNN